MCIHRDYVGGLEKTHYVTDPESTSFTSSQTFWALAPADWIAWFRFTFIPVYVQGNAENAPCGGPWSKRRAVGMQS